MLANIIRMGVGKLRRLINRVKTLVVNQPYSTAGNGGRKLVRLDNGWLVAVTKNIASQPRWYISKDNGNDWMQLCYRDSIISDTTSVAFGDRVYTIYLTASQVQYANIHVTSQANVPVGGMQLDFAQTSFSGCSLAINKQGTELHACWSSKNATYPNSFNIRYSKGAINLDGGVTWGSVEQLTTNLNDTQSNLNPSIVINSLNYPCIICHHRGGPSTQPVIQSIVYDGTKWITRIIYYDGIHPQSNPSSCVDKDGVIHIAWHGIDSNLSYPHIKYSKSIDGGVTWSVPITLETTSNTDYTNPSITVTSKNEVFITCNFRNLGTFIYKYNKEKNNFNIIQQLVGLYNPSCVSDNKLDFESPLTVCMTYENYVNPNSVVFNGKWYE